MPSWFDAEVAELARRTRPRQGERNLILFYGSSTFTLWHDLAASFPAHNVVNHGFGGSTLADCVEYFDQLVTPLEPSAVILYAGDNDLDQGATPEAVRTNVLEFLRRMRRSSPEVPVAYVSIKVSPARFPIMHKIAYTNLIVGRALAREPGASFVDVTRRMVSRGLVSLVGCYSDDPLHMNANGYGIWAQTLRAYLAGLNGR